MDAFEFVSYLLQDAQEFLSDLLWPVLVLALALLFRTQIGQVVARLQRAKGPGGWIAEFGPGGQLEVDGRRARTGPVEAERRLKRRVQRDATARWQRVASIYWAGHDLSVAWMGVMFDMPKNELLWRLEQGRHHVRCIEFSDTSMLDRLSQLHDRVRGMLESDLTPDVRQKISKDLAQVLDEVGAYMEVHQTDFNPHPE